MSQIKIPKNCTACGKELDPAGKFCKECGSSIESMTGALSFPVEMFCPNCGQRHGANDKFCRFCALDLAKAHEEGQNPATAELSSNPLFQTQNIPAQIQQIPVAKQLTDQVASNNPASFISPSGAALVVICFFLPWLEWSACGIRKTVTGAELSQYDGSFLLYPLAGIVSIAAYFICKSQEKIWKARPFILISSALGLLLLFYKVNSIPSSPEIFGQSITAADLGFKPQIGAIGTIIGFILAMIGCAFMSRQLATVSANLQSAALLPNNLQSTIGSLPPNKVAMWCYLAPLALPFSISFLLLILPMLGILGIILGIASQFIIQIVFLNKDPHNRNTFVRFHAYQSIFLILANYAVSYGVLGLGALFSQGPGKADTLAGLTFLLFSIGFLILMIFLAVKSHKVEMYKLPFLGDWAVKLAGIGNNLTYTSFTPPPSTITPINYSQPATPQVVNSAEQQNPLTSLENIKEDEISFDLVEKSEKSGKSIEPDKSPLSEYNSSTFWGRIDKNMIGAIVGVGFVSLTIFVYSALNQSSGEAPKTNVNSAYNKASNAANTVANAVNRVTNSTYSYPSNSNYSSNSNSSSAGSYGRLSTNLNLRTAPNKTALSVGIHFQNARFRILGEESYDTEEGYSTWYKVQIIEYGCDSQGNLGCGKNNSSDADEGWINAKYVSLE